MIRLVVATVGTSVMLGLVAAASGPAWRHHADASARLRLSWSARPERIEVCRTLSEAELADRPEHMRQRVACEGMSATYALRIEVGGRLVDSRVLEGGGLRRDRPMYLLHDLVVEPGEHRLVVTQTRREEDPDDDDDSDGEPGHADADDRTASSGVDTGVFAGRAQREVEERRRRKRATVPASLRLDTTIVFRAREVTLVTFDPERQALRLHRTRGER